MVLYIENSTARARARDAWPAERTRPDAPLSAYIADGKVMDPMTRFWEAAEAKSFAADIVVDCGGLIAVPGYIDVQLNGGFGCDFTSLVDLRRGGGTPATAAGRTRSAAPEPKKKSAKKRRKVAAAGAREGRPAELDGCSSSSSSESGACNINDLIQHVAKGVLSFGVTAFCPTVITSAPDTYHRILAQFKRVKGDRSRSEVLGLHLEGPFISEHKYGAHPAHLVREPKHGFGSVERVYGDDAALSKVDLVTMAPELKGSMDAIEGLVRKGIVVSSGHSMTSLDTALEAVDRGATMVTHMFNAMPTFHHRDPGLIGLLGSRSAPYYGIIVDGVHAHPASVKIAYKAHPRGLVLVTDAMAAMGLTKGEFQLGEQMVSVDPEKKRVTLVGSQTLAGSIATMDECVRNFKKFTGCSTVQALEAATLRPAQVLGITDTKGSLAFGRDADFLLLDDELNVKATFLGGELAWRAPDLPIK